MITTYLSNAIPVVGIAICLYAVLSKKVSTKRPVSGAFMHLALVLWYVLLWADVEGVRVAVWQTLVARSIVLLMVILQVKRLKRTYCPITASRISKARGTLKRLLKFNLKDSKL